MARKSVNFPSLTDSFFVLCIILKSSLTLILAANTTNTKQLSGPEKLSGFSRNGPVDPVFFSKQGSTSCPGSLSLAPQGRVGENPGNEVKQD